MDCAATIFIAKTTIQTRVSFRNFHEGGKNWISKYLRGNNTGGGATTTIPLSIHINFKFLGGYKKSREGKCPLPPPFKSNPVSMYTTHYTAFYLIFEVHCIWAVSNLFQSFFQHPHLTMYFLISLKLEYIPSAYPTFKISVTSDLKSFSIVDVAWYLLAFGVLVPDENDGLNFEVKTNLSAMYRNNNDHIKIHGEVGKCWWSETKLLCITLL